MRENRRESEIKLEKHTHNKDKDAGQILAARMSREVSMRMDEPRTVGSNPKNVH